MPTPAKILAILTSCDLNYFEVLVRVHVAVRSYQSTDDRWRVGFLPDYSCTVYKMVVYVPPSQISTFSFVEVGSTVRRFVLKMFLDLLGAQC